MPQVVVHSKIETGNPETGNCASPDYLIYAEKPFWHAVGHNVIGFS